MPLRVELQHDASMLPFDISITMLDARTFGQCNTSSQHSPCSVNQLLFLLGYTPDGAPENPFESAFTGDAS